MRRRIVAPLTLGIVLAFGPLPARAQGVLDRGTFRLTLGGQEVGSESFTIRQDGTGPAAVTVAQGTVALDTGKVAQELTSWLRVSAAAARPAEYRLNVQGSSQEQITGSVAGGRFSARIVSPAGEMMREYLASDGAVVVDDGLVHQYYFLAQRAGGASTRVALLIPREDRQVVATVTAAGTQPIDGAGHRVDARLLRVSGAGLPERQLWIDPQGRVLRLSIPSRGFVATRTTLPG